MDRPSRRSLTQSLSQPLPGDRQCLTWALDSGQNAGVWGGMSGRAPRAQNATRTHPQQREALKSPGHHRASGLFVDLRVLVSPRASSVLEPFSPVSRTTTRTDAPPSSALPGIPLCHPGRSGRKRPRPQREVPLRSSKSCRRSPSSRTSNRRVAKGRRCAVTGDPPGAPIGETVPRRSSG